MLSRRWLLATSTAVGGLLLVAVVAAAGMAFFVSGLFIRPPWLAHRTPEEGLVSYDGNPWVQEMLQGIFTNPMTDLGLRYEDVEFPAADSTTLRGWFVPADQASSVAVVTVHGGGSDRRDFLRMVPAFHEAGYPVLLFDCRETGISDGTGRGISFGVREHEDVLSAVAYLKTKRGAARVAVVGTSVGAVSSIIAAARSPAIDAVVAEAPGASLDTWVPHMLRSRIAGILSDLYADRGVAHLEWITRIEPPDWWITWVVSMLRWRVGATAEFEPISIVDRIAPRPLLLLHGDEDLLVPVDISRRLFERAKEPKEIWIVPGGGHTTLYNLRPEQWRFRVIGFLTRYLPPELPVHE